MSADESDDSAAEDDEFVSEYEPATAADIIEEAEPAESDAVDASGDSVGESDRTNDDEVQAKGGDQDPGRDRDVDVDVDEDEDEEGAVAGSFAPDLDVTPQRPARENVIFVALGVYLTLLAFAETLPGVGTAPATIAGLTVLVAAGTVLCYGVLVRTTPDT